MAVWRCGEGALSCVIAFVNRGSWVLFWKTENGVRFLPGKASAEFEKKIEKREKERERDSRGGEGAHPCDLQRKGQRRQRQQS